jgi:antirestriction protein ArdC
MATNERSVEDGERSDDAGDRKKGFAEQVAERIIEQLQQGTAAWQKPWKAGQLRMPFNAATQQPYHGVNRLWLASQGYDDPRWMTVRQANSLDASVRRGEKGTMILFMELRGEKPMVDEDGRPVLDADGKQKKEVVEYSHPKPRNYYVFNASQIEGLPALEPKQDVAEEWERHQRCENILEASGVSIRHVRGDRAYYRVSTDQITMPERDQFSTADAYYATAMHELGHSTGHPSRLDRGLEDTRNIAKYAKEELRAEIASLMLGERLDIGHDPGQHAAYVESWIDVLKNDPRELFRAATDAEKITGYVMAIEQKRENDLSHGTSSAEQRATAFEQSIVEQFMNPANDLRSQIASVNRDEVERIAGVVDSMARSAPRTSFGSGTNSPTTCSR